MNIRRQHHGVQKICHCGRSRWPRCSHAWYLRFKTRRGPRWQLSLDAELGRHIGSKTEAEAEAARIRAAILAGTFERAADRLARELRQAACGPATSAGIALDAFAKTYVERASKTSGKVSWAKDGGMFDRVCAYRST